jgi:hypothetical protein
MGLREMQPCICSTFLPPLTIQECHHNRTEVLDHGITMGLWCLHDYLLFPKADLR